MGEAIKNRYFIFLVTCLCALPKLSHFYNLFAFRFWPGLGLPSQRPMLSYQKINPCQNIYEKKRVKVRSTSPPLRYKKGPVKITMYLGLDIITKLKFTSDFDRCTILNVLNYLTKNFES